MSENKQITINQYLEILFHYLYYIISIENNDLKDNIFLYYFEKSNLTV